MTKLSLCDEDEDDHKDTYQNPAELAMPYVSVSQMSQLFQELQAVSNARASSSHLSFLQDVISLNKYHECNGYHTKAVKG